MTSELGQAGRQADGCYPAASGAPAGPGWSALQSRRAGVTWRSASVGSKTGTAVPVSTHWAGAQHRLFNAVQHLSLPGTRPGATLLYSPHASQAYAGTLQPPWQ